MSQRLLNIYQYMLSGVDGPVSAENIADLARLAAARHTVYNPERAEALAVSLIAIWWASQLTPIEVADVAATARRYIRVDHPWFVVFEDKEECAAYAKAIACNEMEYMVIRMDMDHGTKLVTGTKYYVDLRVLELEDWLEIFKESETDPMDVAYTPDSLEYLLDLTFHNGDYILERCGTRVQVDTETNESWSAVYKMLAV